MGQEDKPAPEGAGTPKIFERERRKWEPANYGKPDEKVEKDDRASGHPSSED